MASLQPPSKNGDAAAPDRARRAPTIDDVAALAGVGRATVSRALNDQANVSAKVRAKVMHAVAELDYKVNPQARRLASRSGNVLTLVNCNSLEAPPNSFYFAAIELGALRAAAASGLELSTFNVYVEDQRRRDKVVDLFLSGRTAGLILSPPLSADTALAAQLIEHHCPVVCISPSDEVRAMLPSVGFDEQAAGYEIAHHVVEAGHRRFGYLLGIEGHLAAESRFAGFMRALGEAGLGADAVTVLRGDFSFKSGVELADTLLGSPDPATAIVCANDDMAVGVMFAAHRLGLDMPSELSVVGFDDAPVAAYIWPPLTTIHQPIRRIAARAVERLAEALRRGQGPVSAGFDAIEHHIVLRESVAAPRN